MEFKLGDLVHRRSDGLCVCDEVVKIDKIEFGRIEGVIVEFKPCAKSAKPTIGQRARLYDIIWNETQFEYMRITEV